MEHAEVVNTLHELSQFAEQTGRVLESHKTALTRHEEIFVAMHSAGSTHRGAIEELRKDVHNLGELVNSQSELIASMQRAMVKILQTLGMPSPDEIAGAVN
jgi:hypothetical protein